MKKYVFIIAILLGLYARRKSRTRSVGYTLFKSTGIQTELAHIDIEQQLATGIVTYKGKIRMKVRLNLKENLIAISGSLKGLKKSDMDTYIDMFKHEATFFIDNQISDPKTYYANLISQQK